DHFALGRLDGTALAQRLAGENRIVDLVQDADLAFQRSADDLIAGGGGGRRRLFFFVEQVGKESHIIFVSPYRAKFAVLPTGPGLRGCQRTAYSYAILPHFPLIYSRKTHNICIS